MSNHLQASRVLILNKTSSGESLFRLSVFSAEYGLLRLLSRPKLRDRQGLPDLFETGRLLASRSRNNSPWFLAEWHTLHEHRNLAKSYPTLQWATRFSRFLDLNLEHAENYEQWWNTSLKVLSAMETAPEPGLLYFKALFVIGRNEGYPLKESWLSSLRHPLNAQAKKALASEPESIQNMPHLESLVHNLEIFLHSETPLRCPEHNFTGF